MASPATKPFLGNFVEAAEHALRTERLVFGDPKQIKHVHTLVEFNDAVEAIAECRASGKHSKCGTCLGLGVHECDSGHEHDCDDCDGKVCRCIEDYDSEIAELALDRESELRRANRSARAAAKLNQGRLFG